MGAGKKNSLPVFTGEPPRSPPTVDDARQGLGGRAQTTNEAGLAVRLSSGTLGIVVFASGDTFDVCTKDGRFHRTVKESVTHVDAALPTELVEIAADARTFASMQEQQRIRYQSPRREIREGLLIEKCRYGALVLNEDQKVLAISFRRIWPIA
ncbi:MAG: hypothetical protein IPK60_09080 [Sandaracinaceae bacterium]|nr:hypothetical protein [Sandaracinaceae bacterium]